MVSGRRSIEETEVAIDIRALRKWIGMRQKLGRRSSGRHLLS